MRPLVRPCNVMVQLSYCSQLLQPALSTCTLPLLLVSSPLLRSVFHSAACPLLLSPETRGLQMALHPWLVSHIGIMQVREHVLHVHNPTDILASLKTLVEGRDSPFRVEPREAELQPHDSMLMKVSDP